MGPVGGDKRPLNFGQNIFASAIACCTGEVVSIPLDTAKVRLQIQHATAHPHYKGLIGTIFTVVKEEGFFSLYRGLTPGLHRQIINGGLRIGLYDPIKRTVSDYLGGDSLGVKIISGLLSGAIGITVANPTDLVKVRFQAEGVHSPGILRKYPSAWRAYGVIAKEEGMAALWTGLGPNIARNAIVNAVELASYDQIKESLLKTGIFKDDVFCHLASGLGAGFFAVCFGSPVDVIKSRMMGASPGVYGGVLDAFVKTFKQEGVGAFYGGFTSNFVRLGLWNSIMFISLEQIKAQMQAGQARANQNDIFIGTASRLPRPLKVEIKSES